MSFRTALRVASRPLSRATAAPAVARRAASTSSHGTSSNVPWAIGSAAVFGSMTAYILIPTSEKEHVQHSHNPAVPKEPGEVQFTSQELRDEKDKKPIEVRQAATDGKAPNPAKEENEDVKAATTTNSLIGGLTKSGIVGNDKTQADIETAANTGTDVKKSVEQATKTDAPLAAKTEGDKSAASGSGGETQNKSSSSSSTSGAASSSSSSSDAAPTPNVDDSGAPDAAAVQDALKRGDRTAAPLAAMDQEQKGLDPQASKAKEE